MSLSVKTERALLSHEEFELLSQTHYPALIALEDAAVAAAKKRIRDLHDKDRTFARGLRRGIRGKAETRGASFPGNIEKPARRKQVFSGALKRLNAEVARREAIAAHQALMASAQRALTLKTSANRRNGPGAGRTSRTGMHSVASDRQDNLVNRANVGRVVRATKVAQAKRDGRPGK